MRLISLDSSSRLPAYALYRYNNYIESGQMLYDRHSLDSLRSWYELIKQNDIFVIEGQYFDYDENKFVKNSNSLINLIKSTGTLESLAIFAGIGKKNIYMIKPNTWQSKLFGDNIRRSKLKRLSKELASEIAKEKIVSNDRSDAICLGYFVIRYVLKVGCKIV